MSFLLDTLNYLLPALIKLDLRVQAFPWDHAEIQHLQLQVFLLKFLYPHEQVLLLIHCLEQSASFFLSQLVMFQYPA